MDGKRGHGNGCSPHGCLSGADFCEGNLNFKLQKLKIVFENCVTKTIVYHEALLHFWYILREKKINIIGLFV